MLDFHFLSKWSELSVTSAETDGILMKLATFFLYYFQSNISDCFGSQFRHCCENVDPCQQHLMIFYWHFNICMQFLPKDNVNLLIHQFVLCRQIIVRDMWIIAVISQNIDWLNPAVSHGYIWLTHCAVIFWLMRLALHNLWLAWD